jgi:hypothetical protein
MTTNRDRGALRAATLAVGPLAAGPLTAGTLAAGLMGRSTRLSRRFYRIGLAGFGVTRRDPRRLPVAVGPHPGPRSACTVTPYREDRCLLMPRYAQPGRS